MLRPSRCIFPDGFEQVAESEDHGVGQHEVPLRLLPERRVIRLISLESLLDPAAAETMVRFFLPEQDAA
jgi:hypothetical protein